MMRQETETTTVTKTTTKKHDVGVCVGVVCVDIEGRERGRRRRKKVVVVGGRGAGNLWLLAFQLPPHPLVPFTLQSSVLQSAWTKVNAGSIFSLSVAFPQCIWVWWCEPGREKQREREMLAYRTCRSVQTRTVRSVPAEQYHSDPSCIPQTSSTQQHILQPTANHVLCPSMHVCVCVCVCVCVLVYGCVSCVRE